VNTNGQLQNFCKLKAILKLKEAKGYKVNYIMDSVIGDVMGTLLGCQFESKEMGGYIYFWSSGVVGRQLYDYVSDLEIIEDSTGEMCEDDILELIKELSEKL
jgi:hypothetical protein